MPSWPEATNWPTGVNWPTGTNWPPGVNWPGGGSGPPPFDGNFASLFPTAYQVVQSDRGLTYGGLMKAAAGNTSFTVVTLGGALPAGVPPVPIMAKATNTASVGAGATFDIYYDGGTTPAMVGLTPTGGAFIALTGQAAGLNLTWTANSSVTGNSWQATCAGLADQTTNGKDATQAAAASRPIITPGLNGKVGLLFDGIDDVLLSTVGSLTVFPYLILIVGRITEALFNSNALVSGDGFSGTVYQQTQLGFAMYNGSGAGNQVFIATLTNKRFAATFTASAADNLKVAGLAPVSGTNCGAVNMTTRSIGGPTSGAQLAKAELFAVIYTPVVDYSAFDAALNTPACYGPGAIEV